MNEANYASLEASKRLVEAGIELETEVWWMLMLNGTYELVHCSTEVMKGVVKQRPGSIPAPCMAEVWREFGDDVYIARHWDRENRVYVTRATLNFLACPEYKNTNPTDALIYLLIWVRKEKL